MRRGVGVLNFVLSTSEASVKKRTPVETLQQFSLPLIAGVIMALLWANLGHDSYHRFVHWAPFGGEFNFHFLVNDIGMVFFFGIATKEIVESFLPGGALSPVKKAVNPLLGTLGGVLGPIGVYFVCVHLFGDASIKNGWGIPTATDIAIAWLVAKIVFGAKHPAVSFLLLLAIADDAIGLIIIAVFYPDPAHPVQPIYLLIVVWGMFWAYKYRRLENDKYKNGNYWVFLVGGGLSWAGLFFAGLHPALALVPIVPFMPGPRRDEGLFAEKGKGHTDTLNRFEHAFKLPVDIGLFAFGLANAGVVFSAIGEATWAVLLALAIGKTVGITTFSLAARRFGFPLPTGMNTRSLIVASTVAAIGLTVALFVAGVAFTDATTIAAAKMGALFSAGMAMVAITAGKVLRLKEIN